MKKQWMEEMKANMKNNEKVSYTGTAVGSVSTPTLHHCTHKERISSKVFHPPGGFTSQKSLRFWSSSAFQL
jgi:hypothetical protein